LDESLKHYDLALLNDKNVGYFWYNRGLVKSRLDQVKEAVEDYKEAISKLSEPDYLY
jgi:tetratricopeptide (TPR) repeat protein